MPVDNSVMLIDIGVNLSHRRFDADREAVLKRAWEAGLAAMILTGTNLEQSQAALELTALAPERLFSTVGIHPHHASECTPVSLQRLEKLSQSPQVKAIGECGLDFNRDFSPRAVQRDCFAKQLDLACRVGLPLFVHERDAHHDLLQILDDFQNLPPLVVHCFTGNAQQAMAYLERGFYLGITGWLCDTRRGHDLQAAVKVIPPERLMIETDAPFLMPRDLKPKLSGGRNEPAALGHILNALCELKGLSLQELEPILLANTQAFFDI